MVRVAAVTRILTIVAVSLVVILSAQMPVAAEKRVALVIGNGAYQNVSKLTNPTNDAAAISTMLKNAKFDEVRSYQDLSILEMRRAIADFARMARDADVAVVYYSGHGIEVDGVNYMIPVDAVLEQDTDVPYETYSLDNLVKVLELARRLRLVMLDACRDNPFARSMKRTVGTRAVGRGLAAVEPTSTNTLIGYAAKAGSFALDGEGPNSPYAAALLNHLTAPGLDLRIALGRVRDEVLKRTNSKQEPFIYGSLGGDTVSIVDAQPTPNAATIPQGPIGAFSMNPSFDLMIPSPLGEKSLGRDDAPVTIIEYSSMDCPHCATFYERTFPDLKRRYIDTGKVRFIFREYPLGQLAFFASMIVRCADPEKYYELMGELFRQQDKWAGGSPDSRFSSLFMIASQAGLTEESLKACQSEKKVQDGIIVTYERAVKLGVRAVPSFFINGKLYTGLMSIDQMAAAVSPFIAAVPPK